MNLKDEMDCQLITKIVSTHTRLDSDKIVGVYPFGSFTYDTTTDKSDADFVVIVDSDGVDHVQYETPQLDIHILSINHYKKLLDNHDIMALEVFYNPYALKKFKVDFKPNLAKLRHSISAVVSNSWVKAKKKVELENEDSWVGYKSLFHSMRILDFGIQIARDGAILNYASVSPLLFQILGMVRANRPFSEIMAHFKPIQNANLTLFRQLAPKE